MSAVDEFGLGRLRRVQDPREVWKHEAHQFTPWLARNLDVLGDELGLSMTTVGQEVAVGSFFLDILAEDEAGRKIVIENQLDGANHGHLGQLLVYASGLDAAAVVWVTTQIRDEYRSVLEWLNRTTYADLAFFGVEVGVVSIGDSARAPVFDVVVQPNEWQKAVTEAAIPVDGVAQARKAFFDRVLEAVSRQRPAIRKPQINRPDNWVRFASGPFGGYTLVFTGGRLRVEVCLDHRQQDVNKALFDELRAESEAIERQVGMPVSWERLDSKKSSRISLYWDTIDPLDTPSLDEPADWAVQAALALYDTLDRRLRDRLPIVRSAVQETAGS